MRESENTNVRFERWLKQIIEELVYATCHFRVWEQLWPSTEDIARAENVYINFFQLTRIAHNNQLFLHINKILDRRKDSINIWRLFGVIEKNPDLLEQKIDIRAIKDRLNTKKEVYERLKVYRNKKLAHIDEEYHTSEDLRKRTKVFLGEMREILNDLADIITEISAAYSGAIPSFETVGIDDTTRLLKTLLDINERGKRS